MLSVLELHINVDHLVSENQILIVPFHPGRLGTILYFGNAEARENEIRVDLGRVLDRDFSSVGHQIAQFSSLNILAFTTM